MCPNKPSKSGLQESKKVLEFRKNQIYEQILGFGCIFAFLTFYTLRGSFSLPAPCQLNSLDAEVTPSSVRKDKLPDVSARTPQNADERYITRRVDREQYGRLAMTRGGRIMILLQCNAARRKA